MEAPLELVDVAKSDGRLVALRGVSFIAAPGRVCGLRGAKGSGKSRALRVLLGLARSSGRGFALSAVALALVLVLVLAILALGGAGVPVDAGVVGVAVRAVLCGALCRAGA